MKKIFYAVAAAAAVALMRPVPAAADAWVNGGVREYTGNQNYNGINAFGQVGFGDFSLRPSFGSFHSDVSSGTLNTYALRVGYDTKLFALGLSGGGTPSVNGYSNKFGGVDATFSLTPSGEGARQRINGREQSSGPAQGAGLARIDIGGSVNYTSHSDHVGSAGQALGSVARLGQTDLTASVGVSILESLLSVDVTKSLYDKKPADLNMRTPRVQNIIGLAQVAQGFPNSSTNVKLLFGGTPLIKPYVGYTHTTFQAGQPGANAYNAGVSAELQILEVSANWEHYVQSGQSAHDYVGLGAGVRF